MNFIKNNLKSIIVLVIIIVLIITNTVVNSVISSKIDEQLSDFLKEVEQEDKVKYESISYSFLSSKLTFDKIEYIEDEREYIQIEELGLTFDRDELPSKDEFEEGNFILSLSDSEINASKIKFVDGEQSMIIEQIESSFNGKINPDEDDFNFKHLKLLLNGLEMDVDDVKMELGNLELELDSDDFINLTNLDSEIEELQSLNNLSIKLNLDNYKIPRELSKEMDLDEIGILEIEGKKISLEISKDEDDLNFNFELDTKELGELSLEAEMDSNDLNKLSRPNNVEKLQEFDNLSIKFNLNNFKLPRQLTKEMDLDDIGIREIEGKEFSVEVSKDDDDLDLNFKLKTQNLGELSLESEMDFSKSQKDPYLNLEISLDNLNDDFTKILKKTKFKEKGQNSFEFNYDGNLMDIEKSIM
jgi:hypothetical protein